MQFPGMVYICNQDPLSSTWAHAFLVHPVLAAFAEDAVVAHSTATEGALKLAWTQTELIGCIYGTETGNEVKNSACFFLLFILCTIHPKTYFWPNIAFIKIQQLYFQKRLLGGLLNGQTLKQKLYSPLHTSVRGVYRGFIIVVSDSGSDTQHQMDVATENTIPVVGLLVQGSPRSIDHILFYLQNKMPIVVLKGTGGIADVIAYAYEEILERL